MATMSSTMGSSEVLSIHTSGKVVSDMSTTSNGSATPLGSRKPTRSRYRHVAAAHSRPRTSCLSHDSEHAPSFLGFRNLMVIVLSKYFKAKSNILGARLRV